MRRGLDSPLATFGASVAIVVVGYLLLVGYGAIAAAFGVTA